MIHPPLSSLAVFLVPLLQTLPREFDSTLAHADCRIFNTTLSQGNCGSCGAVAMATTWSMLLCMQGVDFIPSPHRIMDCSHRKCDAGTTVLITAEAMKLGVPDIRDTVAKYDLVCETTGLHPVRTGYPIAWNSLMKAAIWMHGPCTGEIGPNATRITDMTTRDTWYPMFDDYHSVTVTGWGEDHWNIVNTWGPAWGDHGRAKLPLKALNSVYCPSAESAMHYVWVLTALTATIAATMPCKSVKNTVASVAVVAAVLLALTLAVQ